MNITFEKHFETGNDGELDLAVCIQDGNLLVTIGSDRKAGHNFIFSEEEFCSMLDIFNSMLTDALQVQSVINLGEKE